MLQYCFCFFFLDFWPQGMWDFISSNSDQTWTPCIQRQGVNHWTTREVPQLLFLTSGFFFFSCKLNFIFFFHPELLRFNWRIIFCKFKLYNVVNWYMCVYYETVTTIKLVYALLWASLVAQMVKNLPAMWKTSVWSLSWEDPLEEGMAMHSSVLAGESPWTEEPGGLQFMGLQRVGHSWATKHSTAHALLYRTPTISLLLL